MEWWQAVALAVIQGLTEFLPVSSSGHLVLTPLLFGWTDQGLAFDVAAHVGTLAAVLAYFRRDLVPLAVGGFRFLLGRRAGNPMGRLAFTLLLATIPVGIVGLLFNDFIETQLRSPFVVAFQMAVFGIVLWLADRFSTKRRSETDLPVMQGLLIGIAQAVALVPGTSRSGVTMSMGLALGLTREAAARFAFLLAIPGISLAGLYESYKFISTGSPVAGREMLIGLVVSALVGYACIHYFLRFIARLGFVPFLIYRLVLAGVIVWVFS